MKKNHAHLFIIKCSFSQTTGQQKEERKDKIGKEFLKLSDQSRLNTDGFKLFNNLTKIKSKVHDRNPIPRRREESLLRFGIFGMEGLVRRRKCFLFCFKYHLDNLFLYMNQSFDVSNFSSLPLDVKTTVATQIHDSFYWRNTRDAVKSQYSVPG